MSIIFFAYSCVFIKIEEDLKSLLAKIKLIRKGRNITELDSIERPPDLGYNQVEWQTDRNR